MKRSFRIRDIGMFAAGAVLALGLMGLTSVFAPAKPRSSAETEPYFPPGNHPGWMPIETHDITDYIPCEAGEEPQVYKLEGVKPYHYHLAIVCQHGRLIGLVPTDTEELGAQ